MNEERGSDWGAETVALRGAAERDEDAQREERLRRVTPRRRPTMPSPRWLTLGALVVAVALAGAILSSASGGPDAPPTLAPTHQAHTEHRNCASQRPGPNTATSSPPFALIGGACAATSARAFATSSGRPRIAKRPHPKPRPR